VTLGGGCAGAVSRRAAFTAIIFDLDGTLVDSRPGIVASCAAALAEEAPDVDPPPIDALLGKPLSDLIAVIGAGLSSQRLAAVQAAFARHYDAEGWRLSLPYDGACEILAALRSAGVRLFVATNKRLDPALRILRAAGLDSLMEEVYAPDSVVPPFVDKPAMAGACVAQHSLQAPDALVVGDSEDDRLMAEAHGLSFAAAAWGYGEAACRLAGAGVATVDYLSEGADRPIYTVLASPRDLTTLVIAQGRPRRSP
jgi:phosphoglycolate phosphatase